MKLHWSKHWLRNSRRYFQIPNVPWKCVGLVLLLPVSLLSNNIEVHIDQIHPSDSEILIVQSACEELFSENRFLWIKTKKDFCYKVDFILTYWKKSVINLFLCWLGSAFFFHQHAGWRSDRGFHNIQQKYFLPVKNGAESDSWQRFCCEYETKANVQYGVLWVSGTQTYSLLLSVCIYKLRVFKIHLLRNLKHRNSKSI